MVDDGSTDRSAGIFHNYAQADNRFRYYHQPNQGPSVARNTGLDEARGEFIQFLDADDIILPQRFQHCIDTFLSHPDVDIVYSDYARFSKSEGFWQALPCPIPFIDTARAFLFEIDRSFTILIHSFLFRRNIIASNKFDVNYHSHGEDVECWIRIALSGARFQYIDEVLSIYRYLPATLARNEVALFSAKLKTMQNYRSHPKVLEYPLDYIQTIQHYRERLTIALFMEKRFLEGAREMRNIWKSASRTSHLKLVGWIVLMSLFSKATVFRLRAWWLSQNKHTRRKQQKHRRWIPPQIVDSLLRVEKS
jgi:glycosyltransferase involved in cell wall biosynthesis